MVGRAVALGLIAVLCLTASWMLGYRQGQQTGAFQLRDEEEVAYVTDRKNDFDEDRDQVCNEIRRYKLSMAKDLDENTQICGYDDMDWPGNSD
jgi:hypothetical protein